MYIIKKGIKIHMTRVTEIFEQESKEEQQNELNCSTS